MDEKEELPVSTSASQNVEEEFFQKLLREKYEDKSIIVMQVDAVELDNSINISVFNNIYGRDVVYHKLLVDQFRTKETASFILKGEPTNPEMFKIAQDHDMFKRELKMLKVVIPQLEQLSGQRFGPELLCVWEERKLLVMHNLLKKGFVMKNIQEGLPVEHCVLVLKSLAKMHASSVALHERNPRLIESFKNGGFFHMPCADNYIKLMSHTWCKLSDEITELNKKMNFLSDKKVVPMINAIRSMRYSEKFVGTYRRDDVEEFCVLNHGDCWIGNFWFKEENNIPVELVMVDYQLSVYASPAIDLIYLLKMCPQGHYMFEIDNILISAYWTMLCHTMDSLKCTTRKPTEQELLEAVKCRQGYNLFASIMCLRSRCDDQNETSDISKILGNSETVTQTLCTDSRNSSIAVKILNTYCEEGYFN